MKPTRSSALAAALLALAPPSPAVAADPSDGAQAPTRLDRVELTGARERLPLDEPADVGSHLGLTARETPATVQTLTQDELQHRGLRTAREAFAGIPGAIAGNVPGNPAVVMMRGFSGNALSVLQDGVRVSTSTVVQRDTNTWHFERIEVIKGPASVLFGEGALAGAINKVTRQPVLGERQVDALASVGSFGTRMLGVGTTLPLSSGAALRLDASDLQSDSLADVERNRTRSRGLTGSLLLRPVRAVSVLLAIDHYDDRYDGTYQGVPLVPRSAAREPGDVVRGPTGLVVDRALRRRNYNPEGAISDADETTLRARIEWAPAPGWQWRTDLTAYAADRAFILSDTQTFRAPDAAFPEGSFARTVQRFTHDHRFRNLRTALTSDRHIGERRNRFTVGLEANRTRFASLRQSAPASAVAPVDPFAPVVGAFPSDAAVYTAGNVLFDSTLATTSLFAEDALNLTPGWLLVAGLRHDRIDLDRRVTDFNAAGAVQQARPRYRPLSWRLGSSLALSDATVLYAQQTSAAVPVSSMLLQSIANTAFRLTTGRALEAGIKTTTAGGRLTLTGAVYRIRQDDILTRDPAQPSRSVQGGRQSSRGVELSLAARLTRALSLSAAAGWVDARYDRLVEAGGAVRSGNRPINTPARTLHAQLDYAVPGQPLTLGAAVQHVSAFHTDTANTLQVAGRTTLEAQLGWRLAPGATLTLRGRNLTDAFYGEYSGYPATNVYLGAPRSVELALRLRY